MTIANIDINGHTYTDAMWRADWEGTISSIANDIAAVVATANLVGGILHKTLTGDVSLTSAESLNRVYVYSGSLGGLTTVNFDVSFQGLAEIDNNTNQAIKQGLAGSAITATIAAGGTMLVYCDGVGVYNAVGGISGTATGVSIPGTLVVSNGLTVTGNAAFNNDLAVTGTITGNTVTATATFAGADMTLTGNVSIGGTLHVGGVADFAQAVTISGDTEIVGDLFVDGGEITNHVTSGESRVHFSSPNAMAQWVEFDTNAVARWLIGKGNTAEIGAEVGSDFEIVSLTDSGEGSGGVPRLVIYRKTGHVKLPGIPSAGAVDPAEGPYVLYFDSNGFVKVTGV